jgi:hypothetical protein
VLDVCARSWAALRAIDPSGPPTLICDGGVENFNDAVVELIDAGALRRLRARTEVSYSNSLIEAWWRQLKHQWLYLNTLDSVEAVRRLVAFYVAAHNTQVPHAAFRGQTPDEMYYSRGAGVPQQLAEGKRAARQARRAANRARWCARRRARRRHVRSWWSRRWGARLLEATWADVAPTHRRATGPSRRRVRCRSWSPTSNGCVNRRPRQQAREQTVPTTVPRDDSRGHADRVTPLIFQERDMGFEPTTFSLGMRPGPWAGAGSSLFFNHLRDA